MFDSISVLIIFLFVSGCGWSLRSPIHRKSIQSKEQTILDSDISEKGKQWALVLSQGDKLFGLLILIGVIGGAAAFYFREVRLVGIPVCCAAGCFFLKFLITAGDLLAYICIALIVGILVLYIARKHKTLVESVHSIEPYVTDIFEKSARKIQSTETKKEIKKIRDS